MSETGTMASTDHDDMTSTDNNANMAPQATQLPPNWRQTTTDEVPDFGDFDMEVTCQPADSQKQDTTASQEQKAHPDAMAIDNETSLFFPDTARVFGKAALRDKRKQLKHGKLFPASNFIKTAIGAKKGIMYKKSKVYKAPRKRLVKAALNPRLLVIQNVCEPYYPSAQERKGYLEADPYLDPHSEAHLEAEVSEVAEHPGVPGAATQDEDGLDYLFLDIYPDDYPLKYDPLTLKEYQTISDPDDFSAGDASAAKVEVQKPPKFKRLGDAVEKRRARRAKAAAQLAGNGDDAKVAEGAGGEDAGSVMNAEMWMGYEKMMKAQKEQKKRWKKMGLGKKVVARPEEVKL